MEQQLIEAMNWRYAVQKFDTTKKLTDAQVESVLNIARMAPSCFGIEQWHFVVVSNPELLTQLKGAAYGQAKVDQASHLVVVTQKTDIGVAIDDHIKAMVATTGQPAESFDGWKTAAGGTTSGRSEEEIMHWSAKQTYIALGVMVEAAALLKIDAAPMEGFDAKQFDEILGLEAKGLHAVTIVSMGYRDETDEAAARPKVRQALADVITHVK